MGKKNWSIFLGLSIKINNVTWLFFNYYELKKYLLEYGIDNIRLFKFRDWNSGVRYFIGRSNENIKLFIKIDPRWNNIESEVNGIRSVSRINPINFPTIHSFSDAKIKFAAIEFIDGQTLNSICKLNSTQKKLIIDDLEKINNALIDANIIHRDIRPKNLMIQCKNDQDLIIKLFDFSFCIELSDKYLKQEEQLQIKSKRYLSLLKNLGDGFNPNLNIWDDSYSLSKIVGLLDGKSDLIMNNIGKRVYKFK